MSVTVLAVHNDIAFLLALAVQLDHNRINLIPAHSVKNAEHLMSELKFQPDLLIINCTIGGVCAFAAGLAKRWPELGVVAIVSESHRCVKCRHLLGASIGDSPSPEVDQWVVLVRRLTYHSFRIATQ